MPAGYIDLGSRGPQTGTADNTGLNPGNWTIVFDSSMLPQVAQYEVYKIVVKGAQNTTFAVYRDIELWDVGIYGTLNSWDPQQPLLMRKGETLNFAYSDPVTDLTPPVATIWLRYDSTLPQNNRR